MSFSKIVLMAVGLSGTLAQATEYTYKDPVFRVDNPAGSVSNDIAACVFTKTVGGFTIPASLIGRRLDAKGHFRLRQTSDTTLSLEYSAGTTLVFR